MANEPGGVSPAALFLDTLCDKLAYQPELQDVAVLSAPGPETDEVIAFDDIEEEAEWSALGRMRQTHTFTLHGHVLVIRSGSGDDVAREARHRAYELLAVIERLLRDTDAGNQNVTPRAQRTAMTCQLKTRNLSQGVNDQGHAALIEFTIVANDTTTR